MLFGPKNDVISKKKRSSPKFQRFFRPKSSDLQIKIKKGLLRPKPSVLQKKKKLFTCDFDGPFTSQCHLVGPSLKFMGPLNSTSPGVIVPPAPPLVSPDQRLYFVAKIEPYCTVLKYRTVLPFLLLTTQNFN